MLSSKFNIHCSIRCELLLALAYLRDSSQVVSISHHLGNDPARSATRLAESLSTLPTEEALALSKKTLEDAGISSKILARFTRRMNCGEK